MAASFASDVVVLLAGVIRQVRAQGLGRAAAVPMPTVGPRPPRPAPPRRGHGGRGRDEVGYPGAARPTKDLDLN